MTTPAEGVHPMQQLVGLDAERILWDPNAVYIVYAAATMKLASRAPHPAAGVLDAAVDDDAAQVLEDHDDEPALDPWYQLVAASVRIERVDIVMDERRGARRELGVLIGTARGVIPVFGTDCLPEIGEWPAVQLYRRDEALALLGDGFTLRTLA